MIRKVIVGYYGPDTIQLEEALNYNYFAYISDIHKDIMILCYNSYDCLKDLRRVGGY